MSSPEEQVAISVLLCGSARLVDMQNEKKKRRWWRTKFYEKQVGHGLMNDLKFQHISGHYKNFTRMTPTDFENLLLKIGPKISKQETWLRQPISAQDR